MVLLSGGVCSEVFDVSLSRCFGLLACLEWSVLDVQPAFALKEPSVLFFQKLESHCSEISVNELRRTLASSQVALIALMPSELNYVDFVGVIDPGRIAQTTGKN